MSDDIPARNTDMLDIQLTCALSPDQKYQWRNNLVWLADKGTVFCKYADYDISFKILIWISIIYPVFHEVQCSEYRLLLH